MTTPLFDSDESYIAYPPLTNIHNDLRIDMEFKPMNEDGLMFFIGGKKMKVEDFVTLSLVGGHVEFRFELGTGEVIFVKSSANYLISYSLFCVGLPVNRHSWCSLSQCLFIGFLNSQLIVKIVFPAVVHRRLRNQLIVMQQPAVGVNSSLAHLCL